MLAMLPLQLGEQFFQRGGLLHLSKWAGARGLAVNPVKTKPVILTRKYGTPDFRSMILNNTEMGLTKSAKYLGIILDNKLNFRQHVTERV